MRLDELKAKVAEALLMVEKTFGIPPDKYGKIKFDAKLSRRDLKAITGTSFEEVIRSLSEFKRREIIEIASKEIAIIQKDELPEMIHPFSS